MKPSTQRGFTLLEILLVVAAIAILAGIVIVAINPARQLGETRNATRKVDVRNILSAIQQYQLKNGSLPSSIAQVASAERCLSASDSEICKTGAETCSNANLSVLTDNSIYMTSIPVDPRGSEWDTDNGTGYVAVQLPSRRVVVCAPFAELDESIIVQQ